MSIKYDKLEKVLEKKGLKRTVLLDVISSRTLAKLNKNEIITSDTIDKICLFLDCQPGDIMEVYEADSKERIGIRYYKLFDLLNRKNMKKSDLRKILSSATVAKLSKGEYISGGAIEKICEFLDCQPGDIMERVYEDYST